MPVTVLLVCLSPHIQLHSRIHYIARKTNVIQGVEAILGRNPELKRGFIFGYVFNGILPNSYRYQ
jgi:hypothetical protein